MLTKNESDKVIGYVLSHEDPAIWKQKLEHYDSIEEFKEDDYDGSWYKRDVVTAYLDEHRGRRDANIHLSYSKC